MTDETAHILAPDDGDMIAKFLFEEIDEPPAMLILFASHGVENFGGVWEIVDEAVGHITVAPRILLLGADRERQDLTSRKITKRAFAEREQQGCDPPD